MRKNLPKILDLLIFSIYSLSFSLEFLELLKFSYNLPNIRDCFPKFANGLNIKVDIAQKVYEF